MKLFVHFWPEHRGLKLPTLVYLHLLVCLDYSNICLNNRNSRVGRQGQNLLRRSGRWKSETKVSAGLANAIFNFVYPNFSCTVHHRK